MNILQISYHTSPYSSLGINDGGGLNVYVEQISKHLSYKHNVTVVTAEKAENFKNKNLEFYSLNLFEPDLPMDDKELHLIEFQKKLEETFELNNFDVIHSHYWLSGLVAKDISSKFNIAFFVTLYPPLIPFILTKSKLSNEVWYSLYSLYFVLNIEVKGISTPGELNCLSSDPLSLKG